MLVKCVKNKKIEFDEDVGNYVWHSGLILGKIYFVISIEYDYYMIMSEDTHPAMYGPALYPQDFFIVVDDTVNPDWVKDIDEDVDEICYYGPPEFSGYFLEDFHDNDYKKKKEIVEKYWHLFYGEESK